jgi:hypothetical protein
MVWSVRLLSRCCAVFISASFLARSWRAVPQEEMKNAVFFFGSKRSWLFPSNSAESQDSKQQPTDYLNFDSTLRCSIYSVVQFAARTEGFKALILEKEKDGLVCWLYVAAEHVLTFVGADWL